LISGLGENLLKFYASYAKDLIENWCILRKNFTTVDHAGVYFIEAITLTISALEMIK
jgi:hypothetical protein